MYSDYHVHSCFSFDCDEKPENIINQAIKLNMSQICFTDHNDFNWPISGETPILDIDDYLHSIDLLRHKYKEKIQILTGIELGLTVENSQLCKNLISSYKFDFVIGSCHIVDNMDPYYSQFWKNRTDRDAFEKYFTSTLEALKLFDDVDTLGHMDYIVRYSPNKDSNYSVADYQDIVDEILTYIISKNIKLEINTANLAKGFTFPNPHTDIIKRYKELGGRYVTIGSDSHKASTIGYGFDIVKGILEQYNLDVYKI